MRFSRTGLSSFIFPAGGLRAAGPPRSGCIGESSATGLFLRGLTWGPADRAIAEEICSQAVPGIFLYPTPSFKHLGTLQERCRNFVCPDGGVMHFSTAVGTPTVAFFGKENPEVWGPRGPGNVVLQKGREVSRITVAE